jgi:hypothetical protein
VEEERRVAEFDGGQELASATKRAFSPQNLRKPVEGGAPLRL